MSAGGEKRQRDSQTGSEDESPATPTSGLGFVFRPSPLTQVASNLATYNRSSNAPGKAKIGEPILSLGFSKPQLGSPHSPKPLSINGVSPPGAAGFKRKLDSSSSSDSLATPTKKSNLFIQCMEERGSILQEVSGEGEGTSEGGGFIFGQELASRATNTTIKSGWGVAQSDQTTPPKDPAKDLTGKDTGTAAGAGAGAGAGGSLPAFSGQPSPSLPEVEKITGEEGERHVIQISCKLFVYDREARLWKERGRGELRLNDSPQSEGVYQSRLVMRATGSYRVLLNTNVWNGMNCERASPQSLRITAQESGGQFGIYLIKGALKDIHALFTSLDQRLQALRRSFSSSSSSSSKDQLPPPILSPPLPIEKEREEREGEKVRGASFDEDSLVGDRNSAHSSPDSSPERHRERLRVSKETLTTPSSSESNDFMEGEEGRETTPTNILLKSSAETKKDTPTDS